MPGDPRFPSLHVLDHPLILHKLTLMRDKTTPTMGFRALLREIALLMGYEITRELKLTTQMIETPLARMEAPVIAGKKVAIVAVLRAGIVMAEGLHELMPTARTGHIGLYRDHETKRREHDVLDTSLVELPEREQQVPDREYPKPRDREDQVPAREEQHGDRDEQ